MLSLVVCPPDGTVVAWMLSEVSGVHEIVSE